MIKPNELMVGDWVLENIDEEGCQDPCCWVPHQVNVDDFKFWAENDWIDVNDKAFSEFWRPIPITPEILEKNGFKKDSEEHGFSEPYCVYINDDYQYAIKIYPKEGMDRYSRLEIGEDGDSEYMSLLINYVHELQHAMRLVGIEKQIKL